MNILCIEDNEAIQSLVSALCKINDWVVTKAYDGKKALDILEQKQGFDVILLDLLMPIKNGYEFLDEFKLDIPVIVVTADALKVKEIKHDMVVESIIKPIDINEFSETIKRVVAGHQKESALA